MNEAKVYADNYQGTFARQEDFLDFLKNIGRNSSWDRKKSKDLRLVVLEEGNKVLQELTSKYEEEGMDEGILEDTLLNTGLALKVKGQLLPVRSCAIKTILDRACISGSALRKVDKNVYARIINECMKVAGGDALLRISEGKVSAVLGGDSHEYAVLDMRQIFMLSVEYLYKSFKGVNYLGGFFEHTIASSVWELGGEDRLLAAYKSELMHHGLMPEDMKPIIRISTSDVGNCGANIYPMLKVGNRNQMISLGDALKLEHKAGATIEKYEKQLHMVYGKYQAAIGKLSNLLTIGIDHPDNCMMGAMKRVGIPKKYGMEAVELFKAQHGEDPCTAHDIYYGIAEVIYTLVCNGESGSKITEMEEKVARTLGINWREYDMPGEIKW